VVSKAFDILMLRPRRTGRFFVSIS